MRPSLFASLLAVILVFVPGLVRAEDVTFDSGSIVVPMDTDYQNYGMLRAYGLVYALLRAGVPVNWVISPTKAHNGTDFTASARDVRTSAVVTSHGYRGGPFVIEPASAAAAMPIVNTWLAANSGLAVHVTTAPFTGFVLKHLAAAPTIAIFADGNEAIAFGYLNAAGIPDSLGHAWPSGASACPYAAYPDVLCTAQVAGTYGSHHDGRLFDSLGLPAYCQMMSMHWNVSDANTTLGTEVVAEYRDFLGYPVHLFAECQAVDAIENNVNGHFLTTNGYVFGAQPNTYSYYDNSLAFAQMDGPFLSVGGSEPSFTLATGSSYRATDTVMITDSRNPVGVNDVWMTGYLGGRCEVASEWCNGLGKISYLGGHRYPVNLPITSNPQTNGTRLFLNALFEAQCAEAAGQANIVLTKDAPAHASTSTVTFSITYTNTGSSVARNVRISDVLPPGATFVSADHGGTFSGGSVTWNIGDLGAAWSDTVTVTVSLGAAGHYANTASGTYLAGTTTRSANSNTTDTTWGLPYCGDGTCNGGETCSTCDADCGVCPPVCGAGETLCSANCVDLTTSTSNCGACGSACAGGTICSASTCVCPTGQILCGTSCVDPTSDPANCGSCGTVCGPTQSCGAGGCRTTCAGGTTACSGSCVNLQTNAANCGACGNMCPSGTGCVAGVCTCPTGLTLCSGACSDVSADASNCGACGAACPTGHLCVAGSCVLVCSAGMTNCGGVCVDTARDGSNCGACGVPCTGGRLCTGGACMCPTGVSLCLGACVDLASDPNNCGACGVTCSAGTSCTAGSCPSTCGDGTCNGAETCTTCTSDCGVCPDRCGDGTCNGTETCSTCPADCTGCAPVCGDTICNGTESCSSCALDCGECPPSCGDGTCNGSETCTSCASDCGPCGTDGGVVSDGGSDADDAAPMADAGDDAVATDAPNGDASLEDVAVTDATLPSDGSDALMTVDSGPSQDSASGDVRVADVTDAHATSDGSTADTVEGDASNTGRHGGCACRTTLVSHRHGSHGMLVFATALAIVLARRRRRVTTRSL